MDRAVIHIHKSLVDYLFTCGIYVIYLPAYCPFFNPIEAVFGVAKSRCKRDYKGRGSESYVLGSVLTSLTDTDMTKLFLSCGYGVDGAFDPSVNFPSK